MVVDSVDAVRSGKLALSLRPEWLALSAALVLAAYAVLIASWLYIVTGLSGDRIAFLTGARIWFISNLGTLLPGRIWGILQMGAMSAEQGINPVAAGAASVINAGVNIITGMAVGVIAGTTIFTTYLGPDAWIAWALTALGILGLLLLPAIVPMAFRFARRHFKASVPDDPVPGRIIAVSAAANVLAWFLYGAAFLCLSRGTVDPGAPSIVQHTAAYATSYVIGYVVFFVPAGIGAREEVLERVMQIAGLATSAEAVAIALISRLWFLIILVLPALIFLAYRRPRADEKDR